MNEKLPECPAEVEAVAVGFYNCRRYRPGQKFMIQNAKMEFSDSTPKAGSKKPEGWMKMIRLMNEPAAAPMVDDDGPDAASVPAPAPAEPAPVHIEPAHPGKKRKGGSGNQNVI